MYDSWFLAYWQCCVVTITNSRTFYPFIPGDPGSPWQSLSLHYGEKGAEDIGDSEGKAWPGPDPNPCVCSELNPWPDPEQWARQRRAAGAGAPRSHHWSWTIGRPETRSTYTPDLSSATHPDSSGWLSTIQLPQETRMQIGLTIIKKQISTHGVSTVVTRVSASN